MLFVDQDKIESGPLVAQIVATTEEGLIGVGDKLPWSHVKEDMEFFKAKTLNHIVIMGYNTILSLPFKLPKRYMVGVSDRPCNNKAGGDVIFHKRVDNIITHVGTHSRLRVINELIDDNDTLACNYGYTLNPDVVYIAGGGKVYEKSLAQVDIVYRNVIKKPLEVLEGLEVYYPVRQLKQYFVLVSSEEVEIKDGTMTKEIWVKPR